MRANVATGRAFHRCYFTDKDIHKGRVPERSISLPLTQVETDPEWWLMFVSANNDQLKELNSLYRIDWFDVPDVKGKSILELKGILICD